MATEVPQTLKYMGGQLNAAHVLEVENFTNWKKRFMCHVIDNDAVSKEGARNDEWVKIFARKVHTLLDMEDNDDRKNYLDYLCIDLNFVEEQEYNLMSKT
ncbi:hypothetical protein Tco_1292481 [Tanacetum coccineum]